MRIQHNIMAMNAYRNYTNNVSAMKSNLEKLSSGYKINRAGDDAAGLAISEKMRAQITGLETAQKNAKDGISLVQTAEGALTEVHDMLNRMVELATQSANGTYDNTTDRFQLQKEMDQLNSEINRIADSANFNGIKLLDGSMDTEADLTTKMDFTPGKDLPGVGQTLGVDTVLHKTVADPTSGSKFSIDLHDYEFNNQQGDSMTIKVGDTTIKLLSKQDNVTNGELDKLKGADLADKFVNADNNYALSVDGNTYNAGDNITIQGQEFEVELGEDGRINFTQANPPADKSEEIDPSMKVSIGGKVSAVKAKFSFDTNGMTIAATDVFTIGDEKITAGGTDVDALVSAINTNSTKFTAEADGSKVVLTAKSSGPMKAPEVSQRAAATDASLTTGTASINGTATTFKITFTGASDKATFKADDGRTITIQNGTNYSTAGNELEFTVDGVNYKVDTDLSAGDVATITETGKGNPEKAIFSKPEEFRYNTDDQKNVLATPTAGTAATKQEYTFDTSAWSGGELDVYGTKVAWDGISAKSSIQDAIDSGKIKFDDFDASVDASGKLILTAKEAGAVATVGYTAPVAGNVKIQNGSDPAVKVEQKGAEAIQDPTSGDYNVSTTVINKVTAGDKHRLASTYFDLTEDMVTEGSVLTIAGEKYIFTTDMDKDNAVDISSGDLNIIAKKLTEAAENNHVYTVGHDGNRISVTETLAHDAEYSVDAKGQTKAPADGWDLSTAEGIAKSLGFTSGTTKTGKGLTLQIGDTADSYNQLNVSIKDMHAASLGLDKISIADQDSAAKAVDVIKAAINTVSDVRGTLGATQNRLDHTINNLSVMTENIQDAESTIRDVDVAEEMMAYTKNNILIQSAQAMLAQANQVPQGVLQLLQ